MARRNVRRMQWIAIDNARQAALRRGRAVLNNVSVVAVVTQGPGEVEPTVWPVAPEATTVLQRYAATDSSSRNMLDMEEFVGRRIAKLKAQLRRQEAANDKAEANLILHDVLLGHKDVGNVPVELLAYFKKVLEKCAQEIASTVYLRSL